MIEQGQSNKSKLKTIFKSTDPAYIIITRYVLGTIFLLSGTEAIFPFLPVNIMPEEAGEMLRSQGEYFFNFIKTTEAIIGAMFITNFFVPLAILILSPLVLNILLYSAFENVSNLPFTFLIIGLMVLLVYFYRKTFYAFIKPQIYTNAWTEKSSNVILLEEVDEKFPEKSAEIRELISKLENKDHYRTTSSENKHKMKGH